MGENQTEILPFSTFTSKEIEEIRRMAHRFVMDGNAPEFAVERAENAVNAARSERALREHRLEELKRLLDDKGYGWRGNSLISSSQVQEGEGPA